ncbi:MAG: TonB-dependent receptor [Ectothiorhodospiraceae bacterium]|nr:TonB-dependent receptor [Ectothiorhodospiraceae bacterium]
MHVYRSHIILVVLAALFVHLPLEAQTIRGDVRDETGEPLELANVVVEGTSLGAATNERGEFAIRDIPHGTHLLAVSMIGYLRWTKEVHVEPGESLYLAIELKSDALEVDEVVVTGSRREQRYSETPVKINVLNDQVFESAQTISLMEGLSFQPGLRVETNCQNCGFTQVRINGLGGAYSQVLINSRPVFGSLNAVYGLEHLPTGMIDRVEIIRGGGSSLYGSNAVGGTINVITQEPTTQQFEFGIQNTLVGGSEPDRAFTLGSSISNQSETAGAYIFGLIREREPYDHDGDGFSELTQLTNRTIGVRGYVNPAERGKLTLDFQTVSEERRGGNNFGRPPHEADIAEQLIHDVYTAGLTYEQFLPGTPHKISAYTSASITRRDSYYGVGMDPNAYGTSENDIYVAGGQYSHVEEDVLSFESITTAGIEYKSDRIEDRIPSYGREIVETNNAVGMYLQQEVKFSPMITATAGLRADKHSLLTDLQLHPRLNLMVRPVTPATIRLTYSTGFRPPAIFDEDLHLATVGGEVQYITVAEDLGPERSASYSAAVDYSFHLGGLRMLATVDGFYTRLTNTFILEDAGEDANGNSILQRRNGDGSSVRGISLELKAVASTWLSIQSGLTVQESEYDAPIEWAEGQFTSEYLRAPSMYGYLTGNITPSEQWMVSVSGVYTGSMQVPHLAGYIDRDVLETTEAFFDMTLRLGYTFGETPSMEAYAGVYNILDSYQSDFDRGINRDAGYIYGPSRPRSLFGGIKVIL